MKKKRNSKKVTPLGKLKREEPQEPHAFGRKALGETASSLRSETKPNIEEQLTEIYENGDGTMPDMTKFQKRKRRSLITAVSVLFAASLLLAGVAWIGFFVLDSTIDFAPEDVILSIAGDEQVTIGQEARYRIRYRNAQAMPLARATLQVRYPEGFVLSKISREAMNDKRDEWLLGILKEGESGYLDLVGRMYGDLSSKQSFRVFLNYTPGNFNSEFQKVARLNVEMSKSPVSLTVAAPKDVVPGAEVSFTMTVKNDSDEDISNLALIIEPGSAFSKKAGEPESDEYQAYRWSINQLEGEEKVVLTGSFAPSTDLAKQAVVVKVVGWKDDKRTTDGFIYGETTQIVSFLRTDVTATLVINGTSADFSVQPGEYLNASLAITNAGEATLRNLRARLIFEAPSVDNKSLLNWSEIEDSQSGSVSGEQFNDTTRRGLITWDGSDATWLRSLAPGQTVTLDVRLPLKDAGDTGLAQFTTSEIRAMTEVQYQSDGDRQLVSTHPMVITVNSDLTFEVDDEIEEDERGGDFHIITWLLNNTFHELKNIEVTADIYGDIDWVPDNLVVPAGEANFDPDKKRVTWQVSTMPNSVDVLALQFGLRLNSRNPSQTNLTSKATVKATDAITGKEIVLVGDEVLLGEE